MLILAEGQATPGNGQNYERWNSEDKFLIVMETFSMNQVELACISIQNMLSPFVVGMTRDSQVKYTHQSYSIPYK